MVFRVPMSALSGALRGGMRRHGAAQAPASARAASSGGGSQKSAKRGAFVVTSGATALGVYWFWRDAPAYTDAEKPSTLSSAGLSRSVLAPLGHLGSPEPREPPNPENLLLTWQPPANTNAASRFHRTYSPRVSRHDTAGQPDHGVATPLDLQRKS